MDCRTALEILEVVRPDSVEVFETDLALAAEHLETCGRCEAMFHERRALDREIGRAMRDVHVPGDLKARLQEAVASAGCTAVAAVDRDETDRRAVQVGPIAPAAKSPPSEPAKEHHPLSRRAWFRVTVACVLSLIATAAFLLPWGDEPSVTIAALRRSMPGDREEFQALPEFAGGFPVKAPVLWSAAIARGSISVETARGVTPPRGDGQVAAVASFTLRAPRGHEAAAQGLLLVIPKSAVLDPPQGTSLQTGERTYFGPYQTIAWSEGDYAYICFIRPGTLERLQSALDSGPIT